MVVIYLIQNYDDYAIAATYSLQDALNFIEEISTPTTNRYTYREIPFLLPEGAEIKTVCTPIPPEYLK